MTEEELEAGETEHLCRDVGASYPVEDSMTSVTISSCGTKH
jgi:hypothetical protein